MQVLSLSAATLASLIYASVATPLYFGYDPNDLPASRAFWITALVTLVYAAILFLASSPALARELIITVLPARGDDIIRVLRDNRFTRGAFPHRHRFGIAALFVLVVICSVLLGWYTLGSGGPIESPFKDALLAIALLSPFIANTVRTTFAVLGVVIVVYLVCWWVATTTELPEHTPPVNLDATTTIVTTVTAVLIAGLVKWGATPKRTPAP